LTTISKSHRFKKEEDISYKKSGNHFLAMLGHDAVRPVDLAASIIGGMQQGLSCHAAAEFSFFLAVPTMMAVTCYSVLTYESSQMKGYELILKSEQYCSPNW
jgi:undecaprenyl-diphosphatase